MQMLSISVTQAGKFYHFLINKWYLPNLDYFFICMGPWFNKNVKTPTPPLKSYALQSWLSNLQHQLLEARQGA